MSDDGYRSPLGSRYASPAMQRLWGDAHRIGLWRRLWLALAEAERELGSPSRTRPWPSCGRIWTTRTSRWRRAYERRFRHDVMAHVHALGDQAPAARPFLHLGSTSAFVTDNADLLVMREGLRFLLGRLLALEDVLEPFARRHAGRCPAWPIPISSRPSSPRSASGPRSGCRTWRWTSRRPSTGSSRSGSAAARAPPGPRPRSSSSSTATTRRCANSTGGSPRKMGFGQAFPVTGQTYPRKTDAQVLDVLSGIAQTLAKMATDLRLLQHEGELLEPFESEQIGSSAMAYKRNPMRAERICGLARFVISLQANGGAHRGRPVAGAHPRRQRQPPADAAGGLPRHRCHPDPRRQHRGGAGSPGGSHPPPRGGADALHGHRALAACWAWPPAATASSCTK